MCWKAGLLLAVASSVSIREPNPLSPFKTPSLSPWILFQSLLQRQGVGMQRLTCIGGNWLGTSSARGLWSAFMCNRGPHALYPPPPAVGSCLCVYPGYICPAFQSWSFCALDQIAKTMLLVGAGAYSHPPVSNAEDGDVYLPWLHARRDSHSL